MFSFTEKKIMQHVQYFDLVIKVVFQSFLTEEFSVVLGNKACDLDSGSIHFLNTTVVGNYIETTKTTFFKF